MSSNGPIGAPLQLAPGLLFAHRLAIRRGVALKIGFFPSYAHAFADVASKDRATSPMSPRAGVVGPKSSVLSAANRNNLSRSSVIIDAVAALPSIALCQYRPRTPSRPL